MSRSRHNLFWHDDTSKTSALPKRQSFFVEPLERRLLLSADMLASAAPAGGFDSSGPASIVWVNRGAASDNFDDVFGALAPTARSVIDAAIASWNRVITDFNYSDGTTQFDLTLSMKGSGEGHGASASFPSNIIDGKPQAGTITISRGDDLDGDGNGDGGGFFLDPTPFDSSEFTGNIVNAFAGDAQAGSPADGMSDLYTVALLELTHEMGITSDAGLRYQTGGFLVSTGVTDPAGNASGFFWVFDGASINALMTSFDSGGGGTDFGPGVHSAEGGAGETYNYMGTDLFGSEDSGNAFFEGSRRYLVSNKDALILKDAYDYDIVMPETFGTFYSVLDESTGEVLVRGGAGTSADNISVIREGTDVVVSVDLGTDVPGLGPTDAFVTRYSHGEPLSLDLQSGDGDDSITIGAGLGMPIMIDAGGGNDYVNVSSNAGYPVTINGNDGNDTLIANSDVTIMGGAGNDLIMGSDGNDDLSGNSGDDIIYGLGGNDIISGGADNDTIYAGTGNNTVSDGTGNDVVDLSENSVAINYITGGGNDTVIGTAFDDTITGSAGDDRLEGRGGNDILRGEGGANTLIGGDESDRFLWNSGDGSNIIEGGIGNDVLVFTGSNAAENFMLSADGTRFELVRGGITMDVAGVEQVDLYTLDGADSVTVHDLTTTDLLLINIDLGSNGDADVVVVNARAGDDDLTVAVDHSDVSVSGLDYDIGISHADSQDSLTIKGDAGDDMVLVQTPSFAESVVYTPTFFDGGMFHFNTIPGLGSLTVETTEELVYDNGTGIDFGLTVMGNGGDNTITHTPGGNDDAGTFQVDGLLALSYENLGDATLTANGDGGTDTLVYFGTVINDAFIIGNSGEVDLNSRLTLETFSIETLTLEGLDGDDSFTLVPAISAGVYATINFNGGGEASPIGDRVYLVGTAGDDTITINDTSINIGAINLNGIENVHLDTLGGDDIIIYNGVGGITDNITVSSSGVVGGGQIDDPGVTQVDFSGVERIDVNGNMGDQDTLTFAGTNEDDTFDIHLDAAGTDGDPILTLQNSGGTPLLTLRNYTNFDTLNVLGLDGADTFNVYTSDAGMNRNLFVDGGLPSGQKKLTDDLNVFYTGHRPHITHSMEAQNHVAGLVDLQYNTARFLVQYDDIEQVTIHKS